MILSDCLPDYFNKLSTFTGRLRVVSNFGDCDCGAGKINFARARVYFARPTIAIAKIRDYSQSILQERKLPKTTEMKHQNEFNIRAWGTCFMRSVMSKQRRSELLVFKVKVEHFL